MAKIFQADPIDKCRKYQIQVNVYGVSLLLNNVYIYINVTIEHVFFWFGTVVLRALGKSFSSDWYLTDKHAG